MPNQKRIQDSTLSDNDTINRADTFNSVIGNITKSLQTICDLHNLYVIRISTTCIYLEIRVKDFMYFYLVNAWIKVNKTPNNHPDMHSFHADINVTSTPSRY